MFAPSPKRALIGLIGLAVVLLFLVPAINVSRYRLSVARSLSQALDREVTVQGISIQTFPQPGLLLTGVAVGDDPAISAEPMLRADEVLATLRITSLWRGRLEISNLKLKYPSLNLVRANDGRWNLESLLERARQTPSAPTAKTRPETRPRFPYIESDAGRINLKLGNEKKVFALTDADFALWLAAEDEWHMRLEARPVRTDANLSDTGTLKMEGSWRRAPQLHETPISLTFWWNYGQLGQLSRLAYGHDRGWRGSVDASTTITGKPEKLQIRLDARVNDFRRYDIASGESVTLEVHCNSEYNFTAKQVSNLACQMPAGSGVVLAHGSYSFLPTPQVDLSISAENVPMQFLAILARHAKRDLPSDMNVSGMLSAALAIKDENGQTVWAGNGETSALEVRSSVLKQPLSLEPSRWELYGPGTAVTKEPNPASKHKIPQPDLPEPSGPAWKLQPVRVAIGGENGATLAGWFSHNGYFTELKGDVDLARLLELGKLAGLPTPGSEISGTAKGALQLSGEWAGFAPADITGDAQLKNVTAKLRGVASPLRISTAHFVADKDSVGLSKASGTFGGVHTNLEFSGQWPQHCDATQPDRHSACGLQFTVNADQVSVDEVNSLLNPKAQKRPWYAQIANTMMGSQAKSLPEIYAQGQISATKLLLKSVPLSHFTSAITITPTEFSLDNLTAEVFGGKYAGEITADFSSGKPAFLSKGVLQKISMTTVAASMKDRWADGLVNAGYEGQAMGWSADEILSSASGTAKFDWRDGALPHLDLDGRGKPLQFTSFAGTLAWKDGAFLIDSGKLQSSSGIYVVSGTASLGRQLELKLARDGTPGFSVSGSLERPVIAPLKTPTTQARLRQSSSH